MAGNEVNSNGIGFWSILNLTAFLAIVFLLNFKE